MLITIRYNPVFLKNVKRLRKKYRSIENDLQTLIASLKSGQLPGDRIPDVGFRVYKARVRNSDIVKGQSGGYRVIYYLVEADDIELLTIYQKTIRPDISPQEIRDIILRHTTR